MIKTISHFIHFKSFSVLFIQNYENLLIVKVQANENTKNYDRNGSKETME